MHMKKYLILPILIFATFFSACNSSDNITPDIEPAESIIPLSDTYRVLRKRTVYANSRIDTTFNYEAGVASSITFEGAKWYGYSEDAVVFYRNKPDGLYILHLPSEKQALLYKYPATNGDIYRTFNFQGSSKDLDNFDENNITEFDMIIINTNATVTLPSTGETMTGLLHVRKPTASIGTKSNISPADWYLKPGVGSVFFQSYTDNSLTNIQLQEEYLRTVAD